MTAEEKFYHLLTDMLKDTKYEKGICAEDIAIEAHLSRSVASLYLNRLTDKGELTKTTGYPVLFSLKKPKNTIRQADEFESFIGASQSLKSQIALCKSAVIYPDNGLPLLLYGESGTGKSMLAKLMFDFAKQKGIIKEDSNFVELNCADYANNPELLSSVLFGYTKGAFTGAIEDKFGLAKAADEGYLFLDEVHRFSNENQEKLFLLMDQGKYRRLGEQNGWHYSKIRFIFATTETPGTVLLNTMLRRIPITVELPNWAARPFWEKIMLISEFFRHESILLNREIRISASYLGFLIGCRYKGNLGSVRNDIRTSCAQAHLNNQSMESIIIDKSYVKAKTYVNSEMIEYLSEIRVSPKSDHMLGGIIDDGINILQDLFNQIATNGYAARLTEIRNMLDHYRCNVEQLFPGFFSGDSAPLYIKNSWGIARQIQISCKERFGVTNELFASDLAMLFLLDQYSGFELSDEIPEIIMEQAYQLSGRIGALTDYVMNVADKLQMDVIPYSRGYSVCFMPLIMADILGTRTLATAIIISRNQAIAQAIAGTVNTIVEDYVFDAAEIPSTENGEQQNTLKILADVLHARGTHNGVLILSDLENEEMNYDSINELTSDECVVIEDISTNIAICVAHDLKTGDNLRKIKENITNNSIIKTHLYGMTERKYNAIIACISGLGIAEKIAAIFQKYAGPGITFITMDYKTLQKKIESKDPSLFVNTKLIITTSYLYRKNLPILVIQDIAKNIGITLLKKQLSDFIAEEHFDDILQNVFQLFSIEGVASSLKFLDPSKIVIDIGEIIQSYENLYNVKLSSSTQMNLYLHLALMVERLLTNRTVEKHQESECQSESKNRFISQSNTIFAPLCKKYDISMPNMEYLMLYEIIKVDVKQLSSNEKEK